MSFKHKKKYGQNFLNDASDVLNKIIEVAKLSKEDEVLEIGPGEGALTALLLENAKCVTSIEIDDDLEKILRKKFKDYKNYTLVMDDVLKTDFACLVSKKAKIVANIPYYISSPIVNKIIENRFLIKEAYIMVQKEVGERICAKKGKARSVLSLAVEFYGKASYLFTIDRSKFTPIPNVDSAFISIEMYDDRRYEKLIDENTFFKYIKAAFSSKRKNIVNNLKSLGLSKDFILSILQKHGISENERAENIDIEVFISLIKSFEAGSENEKL